MSPRSSIDMPALQPFDSPIDRYRDTTLDINDDSLMSPRLLSPFPTLTSRRGRPMRMAIVFVGALFLIVLGAFWNFSPPPLPWNPWLPALPGKPHGFEIVGLVFYGRRDKVEVLDCYLKRNLALNGGFLDRVEFVANTNNEADLRYLDELVATTPAYKKVVLKELGFDNIWQTVKRGTMYIKIDDDVVYIDDHAISTIVDSKLRHPEAFIVSANIINSPFLGWLHYRIGAIHPYLPELVEPRHKSRHTWRSSQLPYWSGPSNYSFPLAEKKNTFAAAPIGSAGGPPYSKHRWLPLPRRSDIYRTPMAQAQYSTFGHSWSSWAIAAQQHYSFLENLERREEHLYYLESGRGHEGLWETSHGRMTINFIAIWGDDVIDSLPFTSVDEQYLTVDVPKRLKMGVYVNTHALVAHFGFVAQPEVMETDLLDRYRAYASERICPHHKFQFSS